MPKSGIVVAVDVTQCAADSNALLPMEALVTANLGQRAKSVLADSGYKSESNFVELGASWREGLRVAGPRRIAAAERAI